MPALRMLMRYLKLFFLIIICAWPVSAQPKSTPAPLPLLQRPASTFVRSGFFSIDLWEVPDVLDLSRRQMRYTLRSNGTAGLSIGPIKPSTGHGKGRLSREGALRGSAGTAPPSIDEFERRGTFDARLFVRLGALLKARGYAKFHGSYPRTPNAPVVYQDRSLVILYFTPGVVGDLRHIFDYADSAPLEVWELQAAVRGVIQQIQWSGPPLPPINPKSGIRGVVSDKLVSEAERSQYVSNPATVIVFSAKDKHEVARTRTDYKGAFVLGLAPGKYMVEVRLRLNSVASAGQLTRTVEVKADTFTAVDAQFPPVSP